jgi:hypothetical protein
MLPLLDATLEPASDTLDLPFVSTLLLLDLDLIPFALRLADCFRPLMLDQALALLARAACLGRRCFDFGNLAVKDCLRCLLELDFGV